MKDISQRVDVLITYNVDTWQNLSHAIATCPKTDCFSINILIFQELHRNWHILNNNEIRNCYIENAVIQTLNYENFSLPCEVSVLITDNKGIQELNRKFRNIDSPTDVLSFPMYESFEVSNFVAKSTNDIILLGDIVISAEYIQEQVTLDPKKNFLDEVSLLTIHSVLHLLGYDHANPNDKKVMFTKQETLMQKVRTLIHR